MAETDKQAMYYNRKMLNVYPRRRKVLQEHTEGKGCVPNPVKESGGSREERQYTDNATS